MRGIVRVICIAAAAALATVASHAADVRLNATADRLSLGNEFAPRSALTNLDGTAFSATLAGPTGPIEESGLIVPRVGPAEAYGPPGPRPTALRDFAANVSLTPELALNLGYGVDDSGHFVRFGAVDQSFDGLFLAPSALDLSDAAAGPGSRYLGASWQADNVRLALGEASEGSDRNSTAYDVLADFGRPMDAILDDGARTANSLLAGASWEFSHWGGLDIGAAHTSGRDLLGGFDATSMNVGAHLKLGGGWVTTASYGEALAKLDVKPSALQIASTDDLHRTGYAVAVAKRGVFGDDTLGFSVSQPATPTGPDGEFATVSGGSPQTVFIGRDHLLDGLKPETDIEVGYVTTFLDGSVALQTNAAYEMNFQGQNGTNAVSLLSRAKIKF